MAANPSFKPSEGKREEFRKYLEKTGVMDALTKVLVSLYEESEKPTDALLYIQNKLALQAGGETIDSLHTQLTEANEKIETLQREIEALKSSDNPEPIEDEAERQPPVQEIEVAADLAPVE